jgi:hypothetical protein
MEYRLRYFDYPTKTLQQNLLFFAIDEKLKIVIEENGT